MPNFWLNKLLNIYVLQFQVAQEESNYGNRWGCVRQLDVSQCYVSRNTDSHLSIYRRRRLNAVAPLQPLCSFCSFEQRENLTGYINKSRSSKLFGPISCTEWIDGLCNETFKEFHVNAIFCIGRNSINKDGLDCCNVIAVMYKNYSSSIHGHLQWVAY